MERLEGIVCKVLDYKDSSKILYLYTPKGQISIIARGVKKLSSLNRNLSQVGNVISFVDSDKQLPTLSEGELIEDFESIHLDLISFSFLSHILEITIGTISEENDHPKMYGFLKRLLKQMDNQIDPERLSFIFELKLLHFLGYGLNFKGCSQCDNKDLYFSVSDGGLTCKAHIMPNSAYFDYDIYIKLYELYYMNIDEYKDISLTKNETIMIRHIIDLLYDEFIGFQSKSRSILKQIKKY
jgi:DNA repair protein RecO (recombination protein O)